MTSIFKAIFTFLVIVFLSFLLSSFIFLFSLSHSIKPEILKPALSELFEVSFPKQIDLNESYAQFELLCKYNESVYVPLNDEMTDYLEVRCKRIREIKASELKGFIAESMFDKVYYADYPCVLFDCFKKTFNSPFLISEVARGKIEILSYVTIAIFFILALFFAPLLRLKGFASIFFLNSIPSITIFLRNDLLQNIAPGQIKPFLPLIVSLVHYSSILSVISLIIAISLLIIYRFNKEKLPELKKPRKQEMEKRSKK